LWIPCLFNILMDNAIRYWLTIVVNDDGTASTTGMGRTIADHLALFYADNGLIAATDLPWLQQAMDILVSLLRQMGLETNITKTKMMTCFPNQTTTTRLSATAYKRQMTGEGPSYQERQRQRVECPECTLEMSQGALKMHRQRTHGVEDMEAVPAAALQPPVDYYVSFPKTTRSKPCPVPACLG
jgi:Reverse transcriptase (RNA-dependent DNA polymerase)